MFDDGAASTLIDCGLFQGFKQLRLRNWQPLPFDPRRIASVVLTHAHKSDSVETGEDIKVMGVREHDEIGSVFLTVNGTSAEAGDDGQTGRGNRANGLITPCRPMTLEASAGKNPVTHVGKIYNAAASRLAAAVVAEAPPVAEAECYLVSQIGAPVDQPRLAHLRVRCSEAGLSAEVDTRIRAVAEREIAGIPSLWKSFLTQSVSVA